MTNKYLSAFFLCSVVTCTELQAASSSAFQQLKKGNYEEDLALHRIAFCKPPKVAKKVPATPLLCPLDQAGHLYHRLAQRKAAYEQANCLKGYTIQLYMGSSRTAALKIQDLASSFASFPKFHYRQPHYTVQLGFFLDRLEAYFVYLTLVKKIPAAMIRPCMCTKQDYLATMVQADDPF